MIKNVIVLLLFCAFSGFAAEREALLKRFTEQHERAAKALLECDTQTAMTGAAGAMWTCSEPMLLEAAEWRLRQAKTPEERKKILNAVYRVGRKVETIFSASREGTGSIESMRRCCAASNEVMREINILLLAPEDKVRWERVADAQGKLGTHELSFKHGRARIADAPYGETVELEAELVPERCFSFDNRDYMIVSVDLPGAMNSDFLKLYLCRFDGKKLVTLTQLDTFYLEKASMNNGIINLAGQKTHQSGNYKETIK